MELKKLGKTNKTHDFQRIHGHYRFSFLVVRVTRMPKLETVEEKTTKRARKSKNVRYTGAGTGL